MAFALWGEPGVGGRCAAEAAVSVACHLAANWARPLTAGRAADPISQVKGSTRGWSGAGSNRRPHAFQSDQGVVRRHPLMCIPTGRRHDRFRWRPAGSTIFRPIGCQLGCHLRRGLTASAHPVVDPLASKLRESRHASRRIRGGDGWWARGGVREHGELRVSRRGSGRASRQGLGRCAAPASPTGPTADDVRFSGAAPHGRCRRSPVRVRERAARQRRDRSSASTEEGPSTGKGRHNSTRRRRP